jgi:UDP-N-acetylmuramoyl-L-alanyl-D-glutamate--2,6-diaminopimelate ligase
MLLTTLAQNLAPQVRLADGAGEPVEVERACFDSRRVQPGDLYCALPGTVRHGAEFLPQAIAQGAVAWMVAVADFEQAAQEMASAGLSLEQTVPCLLVEPGLDSARVAGFAAAALQGEPSRALHLSAVTGTNGKSTIVHLLEQAWNHNRVCAGRVGTLGFCFGEQQADSLNTTPSADQLHQWLGQIQKQGAQAVALEASSHGIHQQRLAGAQVDAIGWTNLSHDHLDYHGDLETYADAKAALILEHANATALLPAGDARIWKAVQAADARLMSWAVEDSTSCPGPTKAADLAAKFQAVDSGIELRIDGALGQAVINSDLIGRHNAENLLLAFGLLRLSGLSPTQAADGLSAAGAAPGRLQRVAAQSPWHLFVDYAHTPEALQRVLHALRCNYPNQQIGIVCGAGGDRDPVKRGPMGLAAAEGADWCMLTSDNPRTEDPDAILDAVVAGANSAATKNHILRQVDRRLAIQQAVARLQEGDVLLVAGKGHEPYQEIHGVRHPFDDCIELEEAVKCCS